MVSLLRTGFTFNLKMDAALLYPFDDDRELDKEIGYENSESVIDDWSADFWTLLIERFCSGEFRVGFTSWCYEPYRER